MDPLCVALAASAPPAALPALSQHAAIGNQAPALDQIALQLVKRIAWGGTARKGAARIELGAGAWAGTTITVVSELEGVSLELDAGGSVDGNMLGERLRRRLESKGLRVHDVVVR